MATIDEEAFTIEEIDEANLQELIDNAPFGVLTIDVSSHILYANETVERILGYEPSDLVGEPLDVVIPGRLQEAHYESFENYQETGERSLDWDYVELPGHHQEGHEIPLRLTFRELTYRNQPVYTGIIQDLTQQKRRERELERSNEELEQFAYLVSHDLKEPLRMVSNYLQLLERRYEDDLDDDAQEFIEYAVDGAKRMRRMIDSLLTYSRVGRDDPKFERVDCDDVLETVASDLRVSIDEADADLEVEDLPTVTGDRSQLEQVFRNLVQNAIKHSEEGAPQIEIRASRDADEWQFAIEDAGPGIPVEDQEGIFDLASGLAEDSTGLGLAICRKIVTRHGGSIWVESTPGDGATFLFTLPAGDAGDPPAGAG